MKTASLYRYAAVAALLCAAPFGLAQPVTIRVIDAANGHPLSQQPVTVAMYYSKQDAPENYHGDLSFTTDDKGEVHLSLPEPPPEHMTVQINPEYRNWTCVCVSVFATHKLMETGIVEAVPDSKGRVPIIPAKPGEVLFTIRKHSFWQRHFGFLYSD